MVKLSKPPKNVTRYKLREEFKGDFDGIHHDWYNQALMIKKILDSKILTKTESKTLVNIFGGHLCGYFVGDFMYGQKLRTQLEKEAEK